MIGIYKISNLLDGKCYYGSSSNISKRFAQHLKTLRRGTHHNIHLQRAWIKYGEDAFAFEIVEECDMDVLLEIEQKYLDLLPEYNIGIKSSGGDNLTKNPNKDVIIKKMTESIKKRYNLMTDEEIKEKHSQPMETNPNWKGGLTYSYCECGVRKKPKAKTCNRCRNRSGYNNPFYGKTHSKETKAKLREYAKNRTTKPSNSRKVMVDGVLYQTGHEAAKAFGITRGLVNYRCNSDKYNWMFVN